MANLKGASLSTAAGAHPAASIQRRVALATVIGTTVEWYDFFIYATAAGLVFADLFFKPAGPRIAALVSFASVGISFLFRPLGAFFAGHFGDRMGRRAVLVLTLLLMGCATTLIGVLPTYTQVGILAPVLLLVLRILQGISAGGEWGGAVLMAVEHAPAARRGLAGSFPQIGVPLGMLLAAGVNALMTGWISPGQEFLEWGWRVPFLLSVAMIVVGYYVRRAVDESPVFVQIAARHQQSRVPIAELFRRHWLLVILAALVFAGNNSAGYMTTGGFITKYATDPSGPIGLARTPVLLAIAGSAALWLVFTLMGGVLSDWIGRRRIYVIGYLCQIMAVFPMLALVDTGRIEMLFLGLAIFTVGLGFTYGPQAAWYSELFPASVRFSGVSISYALGAILGGAFSPMIATALVQATGGTTAVGVYLLIMSVIALGAVLLLRDRSGIDLGIGNQAEQEVGATVFERLPRSGSSPRAGS
jgi:MFS family permease